MKPQRGADCNLALTRRRTGEKEVRHISAGDQENKKHRRKDNEQGGSHVARQVLTKGDYIRPSFGIRIGILFFEPSRDCLRLGARRRHAHARFQPSNRPHEMRAAIFHSARNERMQRY